MAAVLLGLWLAGLGTRFLVLSSPAPAISAPIAGLNQAIDTTDSFRQYPDLDDVALDRLAAHLTELLEDETADAPLVYIEGPGPLDDAGATPVGGPDVWKRSRYYRRYPWKRQNRGYDPEGYLCNPSREDVFQLLVALHEAREGNLSRTVSFCNRRRPARAIFTNIRFLGRRK